MNFRVGKQALRPAFGLALCLGAVAVSGWRVVPDGEWPWEWWRQGDAAGERPQPGENELANRIDPTRGAPAESAKDSGMSSWAVVGTIADYSRTFANDPNVDVIQRQPIGGIGTNVPTIIRFRQPSGAESPRAPDAAGGGGAGGAGTRISASGESGETDTDVPGGLSAGEKHYGRHRTAFRNSGRMAFLATSQPGETAYNIAFGGIQTPPRPSAMSAIQANLKFWIDGEWVVGSEGSDAAFDGFGEFAIRAKLFTEAGLEDAVGRSHLNTGVGASFDLDPNSANLEWSDPGAAAGPGSIARVTVPVHPVGEDLQPNPDRTLALMPDHPYWVGVYIWRRNPKLLAYVIDTNPGTAGIHGRLVVNKAPLFDLEVFHLGDANFSDYNFVPAMSYFGNDAGLSLSLPASGSSLTVSWPLSMMAVPGGIWHMRRSPDLVAWTRWGGDLTANASVTFPGSHKASEYYELEFVPGPGE